jgi:hypothetical protein
VTLGRSCLAVENAAMMNRNPAIAGAVAFNLLLMAGSAHAVTITVSTFNDDGVNGNCSLREAMHAATSNRNGATDACPLAVPSQSNTIVLPAGTYIVQSDADFDDIPLGGLVWAGTTIRGDLASNTIIDFQGRESGLRFSYSPTGIGVPIDARPFVTLSRVTVQGSGHPWGAIQAMSGALLEVADAVVRNNEASDWEWAGGITATSAPGVTELTQLRIVRTLIEGNSSLNGAGGVACLDSSSLTVLSSTIRNNSAFADWGVVGGGAIYTRDANASLVNATLSGNVSYAGGGGLRFAGRGQVAVVVVASAT